jgi:hypothetical protein
VTITVDPRILDAREWAARTIPLLQPFGTIPQLRNPDGWREWAAFVVSLPAIAASSAPRPERFAQWSDWALAFNVALRLLGPGR